MSHDQSPHEMSNNSSTARHTTAAPTAAANQQDENQPKTNHIDGETPKSNEPVRREETPFSLKHFLKRNTSTDKNCSASTTNNNNNDDQQQAYNHTSSSTGARPKVPLNTTTAVYETAKMKRSPKFSSFDSQASLAEFSASSSSTSLPTTSTTNSAHVRPVQNATASTHPEHCDASEKASFQRSVSTFDIGAGGRRYNTNHRLDGFLRASSIPIADDLLESPTHHGYDQPQRRPGTLSSQEISSALPDFVQDHLLVEHLYNKFLPALSKCDRLPDFTLNDQASDLYRQRENSSSLRLESVVPPNNMPFDLMCNNSSSATNNSDQSSMGSLPFDLPRGVDDRARSRGGSNRVQNHHHGQMNDIPLDLTARNELPFAESSSRRSNNPVESYVSGGGPGNMHVDTFQRLPDFLSDGHVHSSSAAARQPNSNINNNSRAEPLAEHPVELVSELDVTAAGNTNAVTRTLVNSLQLENLRLRQELEQCNTTLTDQVIIITGLQATVDQVDRVQFEQRTESAAQSTIVSALHRQIQELQVQVERLRKENAILKEEGAVGGAASATPPCSILPTGVIVQSQELARDMRLAASSAENHLRQLLSGVDNLRIMAQRLDNLTELDMRSPSSVESQRNIDEDDEEDTDAMYQWDKNN